MSSSIRRIVATGGHSGLGLHALRALLRNPPSTLPPPYHIILYARSTGSNSAALAAADELNAIQAGFPEQKGKGGLVEVRELDLAELSSVKREAARLRQELEDERDGTLFNQVKASGQGHVDVFFLNAAIATSQFKVVQQGGKAYEQTAFVNHFAPLFFLDELRSTIVQGSKSTRIVFTGSELHRRIKDPVAEVLDEHYDPAGPGPWDPAKGKKPGLVLHYGNSKFLQLVGVLKLVDLLRSLSSGKQIEVVYAQPGFIPNTGLNRESSLPVRLLMNYVLPFLPISFVSTPTDGGNVLCAAFSRSLASLPHSERYKPEEGETAQQPSEGGVTFACVISEADAKKGGKAAVLAHADKRAQNQELKGRWWPEECFRA